jgi:hypothetical protein
MKSVKAVLVNRGKAEWPMKLNDDVPLGKVYTVFPETISEQPHINWKTYDVLSIKVIKALNSDGKTTGWFPLECLKLGDENEVN